VTQPAARHFLHREGGAVMDLQINDLDPKDAEGDLSISVN
jgi:hypothetical protein